MAPPAFNYSNGSVVIQNGTIYYSPNCTRPVVIPPRPTFSSDPFCQTRLNASTFRQPVWWSHGWAWQSFVPLSPSFVFTPFESLCAMPRIEEVGFYFDSPSGETQREIRFRMNELDVRRWTMEEERIVKVARVIQLRYGLPGCLPPKPSFFRIDCAHKTHRIAKHIICLYREWFAIWMGYVSYLIAKSATSVPNGIPDRTSPAPDWYNHLRNEYGFSETWLDGLLLSNVCTFELGIPRAGIIFQWSEENREREAIDWYYDHHIPLWFVWSNNEEQAISNDPSLAYLRPPNELIQQALTMLFSTPNVPLAGLILQQYYKLGDDPITNKTIEFLSLRHAPSFVFEFTVDEFLRQKRSLDRTRLGRTQDDIDTDLMALKVSLENRRCAAAEAASSFPYHGLSSTKRRAAPEASLPSAETASSSAEAASSSSYHGLLPEEKGKIFNHYNDFFAARERRQKELMKVESLRDRQAREARARKPGVKNAKVYEWEKTQSSGGREVYQRIGVTKKRNEDVYSSYKSYQRLYNAFANEWDLCVEFNFGKKDGCESDSDTDYDDSDYPVNSVCQSTSSTLPAEVDVVDHEDNSLAPSRTHSRDPIQILSLVYGYLPHSGSNNVRSNFDWHAILRFLGFVRNLDDLDVPEPEKSAMINFFCSIVSDSSDMDTGFENLKSLFNFEHVQRPSENLFVFSSPPSNACQWILGVNSPAAALYVCRYILENPHAHTILTVAKRLLEEGIAFHTLLPLTCSPRQVTVSEPYIPKSYRTVDHIFTKADFDVAMQACQSVLTSPQGRAALLRGGIVGRIAKEYLSIDGVLDGPSVEVTAHRMGYIAPSGYDNIRLCDDELTENEISIICGTYSLYTCEFPFFHLQYSFLIPLFTAVRGQITTRSWFPPPNIWEGRRCGSNWLTWTERCEDTFQNILSNARSGVARPKSHSEWDNALRGQATSRILIKQNNSRSKAFIDRVVPFGN